MHISEGVLSPPVLVTGAVLAAGGLAMGLRKMDNQRLPQVALLSAAFFVASLIHVPVGPSSAHLILNGLVGVLLGWAAVPAIFVALALQAVLFQFGGLTTLGVNTVIMAGPAVVLGGLGGMIMRRNQQPSTVMVALVGAVAGGGAVMMSGLLVALALVFSGDAFGGTAKVIAAAHIPVMALEAIISATTLSFLVKVRPAMVGLGVSAGRTH